jgi:hypothetical protein
VLALAVNRGPLKVLKDGPPIRFYAAAALPIAVALGAWGGPADVRTVDLRACANLSLPSSPTLVMLAMPHRSCFPSATGPQVRGDEASRGRNQIPPGLITRATWHRAACWSIVKGLSARLVGAFLREGGMVRSASNKEAAELLAGLWEPAKRYLPWSALKHWTAQEGLMSGWWPW